jgi:acyl dehydratase
MEAHIENVLTVLKTATADLETRISERIATISNITSTEDERVDFRRSVRDNNRIHSDIELARAMGFTNTPIVGVYSASLGERLAREILGILNEHSPNFVLAGQDISFIRAMYPGDKASWSIAGYDGSLDQNQLNINLTAKRGMKKMIEMTIHYGMQKPSPIDPTGNLLYTHEFTGENGDDRKITSEDVATFYRCIRDKPIEKMAHIHTAALAPAGLLRFQRALNEKNGTSYGGGNLVMNSVFVERAQPGDLQIRVYKRGEETQSRKGWIFPFHATVEQKGRVKTYTNLDCLSNGWLDIESLAA